jgi:hypothetical protein
MVLLITSHQPPLEISGVLVDTNRHGFRARHTNDDFKPNDIVSFIHRLGEGVARVIWTEGHTTGFETGFAYLEQ